MLTVIVGTETNIKSLALKICKLVFKLTFLKHKVSIIWHQQELDATRPVSSKCRRTSSHWSQTPRSHLANATSPALASGPEADRLQAGVPCSLVTGWTSSSPRIFTSLLQVQVASSVPLYGQVVQCPTHVRPATEALPQQGLVCGTVYHRIYATKNSVFGASGAC